MNAGTAAIVLCAGMGTRMKSKRSKLLHLVCGRPLCFWALDAVTHAIDGPVVAVIGYQADDVKAAIVSRYGDRVQFAVQPEQRGTGDAVRVGIAMLPKTITSIVVMCGDTPLLSQHTISQLLQRQRKQQVSLALLTTKASTPTGYGRILRNMEGDVVGIVEEKDATYQQRALNEINPGVYTFDADFLRESLPLLQPNNAKHEYYLTDVVAMATKHPGTVATIEVPFEETVGVNDRCDLSATQNVLRKRMVENAMRQGVTCEDPASTYIEAEVKLGQDIVLGAGVMLFGNTEIADDVQIDAYTTVRDCVVASGAHILSHSVCEGARIGTNTQVGPFARLRPDAVLDSDVKIGNFVEVKKSHFKKGAKANHLAYIGDAQIGAHSNVGAGTITCNYDGFGKHPTILGEGVFVGSNSTLVAPVTIENNAYVGAGSVVTKNVPADALAIGRARQENKEGYASKIREMLKKQAATNSRQQK